MTQDADAAQPRPSTSQRVRPVYQSDTYQTKLIHEFLKPPRFTPVNARSIVSTPKPGTAHNAFHLAPTITFGAGTFSSGTVSDSATGNGTEFALSGLAVTSASSGYPAYLPTR